MTTPTTTRKICTFFFTGLDRSISAGTGGPGGAVALPTKILGEHVWYILLPNFCCNLGLQLTVRLLLTQKFSKIPSFCCFAPEGQIPLYTAYTYLFRKKYILLKVILWIILLSWFFPPIFASQPKSRSRSYGSISSDRSKNERNHWQWHMLLTIPLCMTSYIDLIDSSMSRPRLAALWVAPASMCLLYCGGREVE